MARFRTTYGPVAAACGWEAVMRSLGSGSCGKPRGTGCPAPSNPSHIERGAAKVGLAALKNNLFSRRYCIFSALYQGLFFVSMEIPNKFHNIGKPNFPNRKGRGVTAALRWEIKVARRRKKWYNILCMIFPSAGGKGGWSCA